MFATFKMLRKIQSSDVFKIPRRASIVLFRCLFILLPVSTVMAGQTIKGPTVPTGIYTIQQASTKRFLSAHTTSSKDFSAFTDTLKIDNDQMWYIKFLKKGTYSIRQLSNNRFLDAYTDTNHAFDVVTRPPQNNNTQRWIIKLSGNDLYTIQHKSNHLFLDAHDTSQGAFSVVNRSAQTNNTQRWIIKRTTKVPVKGTIDFDLYCKKNFGSEYTAVLKGNTALDWVCQTNKGIRAKTACKQQYGSSVSGSGYTDKNNPYSWYCAY